MKISQREARRLRKRVYELEAQEETRRRYWGMQYPGGSNIASITLGNSHEAVVAVRTARRLAHAVVAVDRGDEILFAALPLAKQP